MSDQAHEGRRTTSHYLPQGEAQEIPPGYKRTEVGVIPEDWKLVPLGRICSMRSGEGITGAHIDTTSRYPCYGGNGLRGFTNRFTHSGQFALIGRQGALCGNVVGVSGEFFASEHAVVVTAFQQIDIAWLIYVLGAMHLNRHSESSAQPGLSVAKLLALNAACPPTKVEQSAIAEALSDVDGLLGALEALIAKKRAIKQAAMQQLLTSKTRLPGFSGEWTTKRIGEFTDCVAGGTPSTLIVAYWGGGIRWMSSGELSQRFVLDVEGRITAAGLRESSTKIVPPRCVLIGLAGQGKTRGTVAMNIVELCTNQSIAAIFPNDSFVPEYLYYNLDSRYGELRGMSTGDGGRGGLNLRIIRLIAVPFPSVEEQSAIARILSDMDGEIAALEARLDKTRAIKQGMMRQLLTGRVRLVKPQAVVVQTAVEAKKAAKAPSWAFKEAVIISMLARYFGTENYPLGRKRYTKLSYLLHRHAKGRAEGYLKKAAGPYNPKTKYGGPERIALKNGYVREHKSGSYSGFVAADNIAQAETYFAKWYGQDALQWLNQFHFRTNDELEVLATVDMAVMELRAARRAIDLRGVKGVIRSHPEWQPKLNRSVFSDDNIAKAIEMSRSLFGSDKEPVA